MGRQRQDLSGQKFGRWTVLEFSLNASGSKAIYKCLCRCGTIKLVRAQNLIHGDSTSCGCFQKEDVSIRSRCENPELISPKRIWKSNYSDGCGFETFLKLSQQNCYYCGSPPANQYNAYASRFRDGKIAQDLFEKCEWSYNGLDRLDPNRGHDEDNVVPSCFKCNRAKDDMMEEEFAAWITKVYHHYFRQR